MQQQEGLQLDSSNETSLKGSDALEEVAQLLVKSASPLAVPLFTRPERTFPQAHKGPGIKGNWEM